MSLGRLPAISCLLHLPETTPLVEQQGVESRIGLPAAQADVDVAGIDLHRQTRTAEPLCGDEGGAGAAEGVVAGLAALAAVAQLRFAASATGLAVGCSGLRLGLGTSKTDCWSRPPYQGCFGPFQP